VTDPTGAEEFLSVNNVQWSLGHASDALAVLVNRVPPDADDTVTEAIYRVIKGLWRCGEAAGMAIHPETAELVADPNATAWPDGYGAERMGWYAQRAFCDACALIRLFPRRPDQRNDPDGPPGLGLALVTVAWYFKQAAAEVGADWVRWPWETDD